MNEELFFWWFQQSFANGFEMKHQQDFKSLCKMFKLQFGLNIIVLTYLYNFPIRNIHTLKLMAVLATLNIDRYLIVRLRANLTSFKVRHLYKIKLR